MSVWMSVYLAFQIRLWLFWIEPHFFLLKEAPFYDESTTTRTCDQDSNPVRHTSTTISRASPWGWGRQSPFSKQSTTQLPQLSQVMLLHLSKVSPSMIAHSLLSLTVGQHLRKKKISAPAKMKISLQTPNPVLFKMVRADLSQAYPSTAKTQTHSSSSSADLQPRSTGKPQQLTFPKLGEVLV